MSKRMAIETWLSLSEAAAQLGVHRTTLRRWANHGDVPSMRTPGGHRRFAASVIERFAQEGQSTAVTSAAELVWAQQAMIQTRHEISRPADKPWLTAVAESNRLQHRLLGQQLMGLTLQYVSAVSNHERLLEEARQIGLAYGRLAQADQMSLPDVLQATLFFRDMLVETALNLSPAAGVQPEDNLRLTRRISQIMNSVHLAIASTYEA
jgi:excisionase family DNA binding protein